MTQNGTKYFDFSNIRGDLFGGLTAGIVALPLALAFGAQTEMGAVSGMYGAIVVGLFAALFGGTPTQVSGPTGPMTVVSGAMIAEAIGMTGSLPAGLAIIIPAFVLSGLIQIALGVGGIGKYVRFMPYPVVSGFMSGIGVIIILLQVFQFFGHPNPGGILDIFREIATPLSAINWGAVGLAAGSIAIIYAVPRITKAIPSTLVALLVMTIVAVVAQLDVPVIGAIPTDLPEVQIGMLLEIPGQHILLIFEYAATLALLGAVDSLLTSIVADNLTRTHHDSNRELIGQGIGNALAGLIGGLPGAGATMRTVININSGGKTRISGMAHSLILLLVMLALGPFAAKIPMSVLAGILITVGIGIVDYRGFKNLLNVPRADASVLIIVLLITVFGNLLVAVGVGIVLASLLFMKRMSDIAEVETKAAGLGDFAHEIPWEDEGDLAEIYDDQVFVKHMYGPFFFGITSFFREMAKQAPGIEVVVIRLERVPYMDQSGLDALENVTLDLVRSGVKVLLTGARKQPLDMMEKVQLVPELIPRDQIFEDFADCSEWILEHIDPVDNRDTGGAV